MVNLNSTITFGAHKGKTYKELIDLGAQGRNYLSWAANKIDWLELGNDISHYLKTGQVIEAPKESVEYDASEFWGSVAINGYIEDIPF